MWIMSMQGLTSAVSVNGNYFPSKAKSSWEMVFKFPNCSIVYVSFLCSVYMFVL